MRRFRYRKLKATKTAAEVSEVVTGRRLFFVLALITIVVIIVGVALYFTNTYSFGIPRIGSSSNSTPPIITNPNVVFSTDLVHPAVGSRAWNVNKVGTFVAGSYAVLTCTAAPGLQLFAFVVAVDSLDNILVVYIDSIVGTEPAGAISPWVFSPTTGLTTHHHVALPAPRRGLLGVLCPRRLAMHRHLHSHPAPLGYRMCV
jgi:hypothetical protein